jgi:hypothetical protein
MTYSVEIRRIRLDSRAAVYRWSADGGGSGHILVDLSSARLRPCDEEGHPAGDMYLDLDEGRIHNADPASVDDFATVAAGIDKNWDRPGAPPETAHRIFA